MKEIAVESGGFARRIYETSDAAIQLEDLYSRIASPLLYDLTVEYVGASFSEKTDCRSYTTFYKAIENWEMSSSFLQIFDHVST